jgi:hypothetical protein
VIYNLLFSLIIFPPVCIFQQLVARKKRPLGALFCEAMERQPEVSVPFTTRTLLPAWKAGCAS